jgi:hypothetical protein
MNSVTYLELCHHITEGEDEPDDDEEATESTFIIRESGKVIYSNRKAAATVARVGLDRKGALVSNAGSEGVEHVGDDTRFVQFKTSSGQFFFEAVLV